VAQAVLAEVLLVGLVLVMETMQQQTLAAVVAVQEVMEKINTLAATVVQESSISVEE
jgi:hypothetical protein